MEPYKEGDCGYHIKNIKCRSIRIYQLEASVHQIQNVTKCKMSSVDERLQSVEEKAVSMAMSAPTAVTLRLIVWLIEEVIS